MPRSAITVGVLDFLRTHDLIKIELRTGETAWLGSGRVTVVDPTTGASTEFVPGITNVGESRQSALLATDRIPLSIQNVDKVFGLMVTDPTTQLAGAKCYFIKYFQNIQTPSLKEARIVMKGEITDVQTDEGDVKFTLISNLSVGLASIGGQQLQSSCPLTFKSKPCGWTVGQGGNATYCDKQYISANGCSGHNNQHRFQGVVVGGELSTPVYGPDINASDGGSADGPIRSVCFIEGTPVTVDYEGTKRPIESIKPTDYVRSFNTELEFSTNLVLGTTVNRVNDIVRLEFDDDTKLDGVTLLHPFFCADKVWIPAGNLEVGDKVYTASRLLATVVSTHRLHYPDGINVYNMTVENDHTYIVGGKLVHNNSPAPYENLPEMVV